MYRKTPYCVGSREFMGSDYDELLLYFSETWNGEKILQVFQEGAMHAISPPEEYVGECLKRFKLTGEKDIFVKNDPLRLKLHIMKIDSPKVSPAPIEKPDISKRIKPASMTEDSFDIREMSPALRSLFDLDADYEIPGDCEEK